VRYVKAPEKAKVESEYRKPSIPNLKHEPVPVIKKQDLKNHETIQPFVAKVRHPSVGRRDIPKIDMMEPTMPKITEEVSVMEVTP
jgi:hypothetical protein